jgi:protein pelota
MFIIRKNLKAGEVTLRADNADDLWHLSQVISASDFASGKTERKIKLSNAGPESKSSSVKKTVYIEVLVEKVEFGKHSGTLRLNGKVTQGPEDVPRGSYHTIDVEQGSVVTIRKDYWSHYQLDKLREATQSVKKKILILVFDREEAFIAQLKGSGFEVLTALKGEVSKKRFDNTEKKNFYGEISKALQDYDKRLNLDSIIVASPSFWKEYLLKELPDSLKKKTVLAKASDVSESSIAEVIRSPEMSKVLEHERAAKELIMIEDLMGAISNGLACYGVRDCEEKIGIGAVKGLLVAYTYLGKARLDGGGRKVEFLLRSCEDQGGIVHVLCTEHAEKKLLGLGGIAGTLRWKAG